jgi:hypothetical protein
MGDAAEEVVTESDDTARDENPDPMVFSVGDDTSQADADDKKEEKPAEKAETPDYGKQITELLAKNEELQKQLNRKFYNLRKESKEKKAEGAETGEKPQFTDAQLLKILEEHRDDPSVTLQVMKHMTEQAARVTKKEAVEDTAILQQKIQAESWLKQNIPQLYEDGSELREKTDEIRSTLRLNDHPLGDFLAVAAAQVSAIPNMIKQAREDERKKALAEAAEASRKAAVKGGGPAGNKGIDHKGGGGEEASFRASGKSMGLTGGALELYITMRKNAKNQRQVMEA